MKSLCIYHGNCVDGFGAAWAVRKALGENNVEFFAGFHGDNPPDCTDREVLIVDFSYKRPVLLEMAKTAKRILILDHHLSAQGELTDLPDNVTAVFDMNRSGAMMAWDHFFPDKNAPALIKHVQDRDLWRFEMMYTKEFVQNLFSFEYDFEVWDEIVEKTTENYSGYTEFVAQGKALIRKHTKDILEMVPRNVTRVNIAGHEVPVLNAPYFYSSEAGHIMAKGEKFAACYWQSDQGITFSLRSNEDGLDVSEVAKKFGGGGHRNAAGFSIAKERLLNGVIDELTELY